MADGHGIRHPKDHKSDKRLALVEREADLFEKLGIRDGWAIAILNAPQGYERTLKLPGNLRRKASAAGSLGSTWLRPAAIFRLRLLTPRERGLAGESPANPHFCS